MVSNLANFSFVHCNTCLRRDNQAKFHVRNCGHLFCELCVGDKVCKVCRTSGDVIQVEKSGKEMKDFFLDIGVFLKKAQKMAAFQSMHLTLLAQNLTIENKKHKAELVRARKEIQRLQQQMSQRCPPSMDQRVSSRRAVKGNLGIHNYSQSGSASGGHVEPANPLSQRPFNSGDAARRLPASGCPIPGVEVEVKPPWGESYREMWKYQVESGGSREGPQADDGHLRNTSIDNSAASKKSVIRSTGSNEWIPMSQRHKQTPYSRGDVGKVSQMKNQDQKYFSTHAADASQASCRANVRQSLPCNRNQVPNNDNAWKSVENYPNPVADHKGFSLTSSYFSESNSLPSPLPANRKKALVFPYAPRQNRTMF